MREALLPSYATALPNGKVEVDADKFYPLYLKELWSDDTWPTEDEVLGAEILDKAGNPTGKRTPADLSKQLYKDLQRTEPDRYWLEVAYTCMKLDIQKAVAGTELSPSRGACVCIVKDASKATNEGVSKWALGAAPEGRGVEAAVQGRQALAHYKRIRGGVM